MSPPAPANVTERQEAFAHAFVELGDPHKAAVVAGFEGWYARNAATTLMARPNVMLAIVQAARGRLARGVPLALTALEHLVEKAASERVRLEAAKALLDRAGLVAPKPSDERSPIESPLHELSIEALKAKVARTEDEIVGRAKIVKRRQIPPTKCSDDKRNTKWTTQKPFPPVRSKPWAECWPSTCPSFRP